MSTDIGKWSEQQRLKFIERLLFWRGTINRRDLLEHFGISSPQATNDLVNYSTLNPGGCRYNVRTRRYESGEDMELVLTVPDFGRDMQSLGNQIGPQEGVPFVVEPEQPARGADPRILRDLCLAAHRQQSVDIHYYSVHSGTAVWRRISPRAFGNDGLRWHTRAYCPKNEDFRDFVIGRIRKVREPKACPAAGQIDEDWISQVKMHLRPNPAESENVRKAIAMDYGIKGAKLVLPVRKAMLVYTARRLGFIKDYRESGFPMTNELQQLEWFDLKE